MNISYTHEIPMGHRLQNHPGKCRFLHGHNYSVKTVATGLLDPSTGMVLDFHDLKKAVRDVLDPFDHAFVLQTGDNILREVDQDHIIYIDCPPTAENLALLWEGRIYDALRRYITITVTVAETRDCTASTQ